MYLVSACLAGFRTRYDGGECLDSNIQTLIAEGKAIPICPEQLGGLPTPREPIGLVDGDGEALLNGAARALGNESKKDYTANLIRGAEEALNIAKIFKVKGAFMKDGSPSCGFSCIKAGNDKISGVGVTTAILKRAGIKML
jgi:uncharacterized protein YbbK (DUF523 family)